MLKNFPNEEKDIRQTATIRQIKLDEAKTHVLELHLPKATLDQSEIDKLKRSQSFERLENRKRDTGNEESAALSNLEKQNFMKI